MKILEIYKQRRAEQAQERLNKVLSQPMWQDRTLFEYIKITWLFEKAKKERNPVALYLSVSPERVQA